ncbi:MAG: hypothetical protein ACREEM_51010 [Blastocatellia bacterium]
MNETLKLEEEQFETEQKAEELPIDRPRKSGFVLKPINREAAISLLESFLEEDDEEQRETFSLLTQAIDDGRRARGERLLFEEYEQADCAR